MRSPLLFVLLFVCSAYVGRAQQWLTDTIQVSAGTQPYCNAVVYLPPGYSPAKTYPLVVYLHGAAAAGTNPDALFQSGLPKLLKGGFRPSFDFIMIAPQSAQYGVDPRWLPGVLTYAQRWAVDSNRIYLTGIDAGGLAAIGSQITGEETAAKKIAAIVIISAAVPQTATAIFNGWQRSQTPLWAIVGAADKKYARQNAQLVDTLNARVPGLARLTVLPATGHGGWNAVYSGEVKLDGKTVWEWLHQFDLSKTFSKPHATLSGVAAIASSADSLQTVASTATNIIHIEAESYASMSGIQTQTTTDAGGGKNIGWIDLGDWMKYSVPVAASGTYTLALRVATTASNATVQVRNGSGATLATIAIPPTSSFQTWRTVQATLRLALCGTQTVQLFSNTAAPWNINWLELQPAPTAASEAPAVGAMLYSGLKLEAEAFNAQSGVLQQATRDFAGGTQNLYDINPGDWVSYSVNAPAAGLYTLCFRIACNTTGAKLQVKNSGGTVLTTVNVPSTNSLQAWRDVTAVVTLATGPQTIKLQSAGGSTWNLNYFEVAKTPLNLFAAYTLRRNSGDDIYLPNGLNLAHLKPGDTLKIPGGAYDVIDIGAFKGTASNPLIIQNRGGQVTCTIIRLSNMPEHFKFLGNGHRGITYGFKINGGNTTGSGLTAFGTGIEIGYVEVLNSKSGFFIKKNPVAGDQLSQHPYYLMDDVYIHHNYVHDIAGEGMYIGHTAADGGQGGNLLLPVRMRNVEVAYNIVDKTTWDGIQLANATTGNSIHHNTVTNFGTTNSYAQQAGILLGGNSSANIYDNVIKNGTGNGIQNFGFGLNKIYNNQLENVGRNGTERGVEAIFCNDIVITSEARPKQQIQAYNNIIKTPMPWGAIRVSGYNNNSLPATMQYNKVQLTNAPADWERLYFPTYVPNSIINNNQLLK